MKITPPKSSIRIVAGYLSGIFLVLSFLFDIPGIKKDIAIFKLILLLTSILLLYVSLDGTNWVILHENKN